MILEIDHRNKSNDNIFYTYQRLWLLLLKVVLRKDAIDY